MKTLPETAPRTEVDSPLSLALARFCLEGHTPPHPSLRAKLGTSPAFKALRDAGTALWLDSGDVEAIGRLWTRELTALTTNNTLLNKEVQKGVYDELVKKAARRIREVEPGIAAGRLVEEIAFVLNAVHGLKLVSTFDADVSVELHTAVARDAEASYRYGRRFHAICPDRFIVKVPLTAEGIFAARRLAQDGIRVNFTLGFSARQNLLIGHVARPDFVNVFLGRLNSFVADNHLGDGRNVGEKATLESQRRVRRLNAEQGSRVRQIGASIRNGRQCVDLAGMDVLTIPIAAVEEYLALGVKPGEVRDRTGEDPEVRLGPGLDLIAEGLHVFWDVGGLPAALQDLGREDLDSMNGEDLRRFLGERGLGDMFPAFSESEAAQIARDGKIPVYSRWRDRVRAGSASWDGLLTASALASFASDQTKLDDRIRSLL